MIGGGSKPGKVSRRYGKVEFYHLNKWARGAGRVEESTWSCRSVYRKNELVPRGLDDREGALLSSAEEGHSIESAEM